MAEVIRNRLRAWIHEILQQLASTSVLIGVTGLNDFLVRGLCCCCFFFLPSFEYIFE